MLFAIKDYQEFELIPGTKGEILFGIRDFCRREDERVEFERRNV